MEMNKLRFILWRLTCDRAEIHLDRQRREYTIHQPYGPLFAKFAKREAIVVYDENLEKALMKFEDRVRDMVLEIKESDLKVIIVMLQRIPQQRNGILRTQADVLREQLK